MKKTTNMFKRLQAAMKVIKGDRTQLIRTQQDQIDYLLEKVAILEEIARGKNNGKRPEFSDEQKNGWHIAGKS